MTKFRIEHIMKNKFNQAFEYHQNGQLTQARDLYEQILYDEPQNHEVLDLLGILYTQVGQYDKALEYLQKAIDLKPLPFYIENLAKMYFKKEDFQNAVELYEILIKNDPNNYENTFNLAMAYKNNGQYGKAKGTYYKAIELNPNSTESYFNLAYLCFNDNDAKGAIECYKKVLKINPDDWETMYFLSLAYMQDKNYKDGLKCFEQRLCKQSAIVSQEKTYPNLMKQKPIWTGKEDLSDKTLYTYYEAGFGDVIMLYRFMPELVSKCKKVIFKPQEELKPLFEDNSYGAEIMGMFKNESDMDFDYHLPFLSLPLVLGKSGEDMFIHHNDGYIKPNPDKVKFYKENYFNNDKFKIGIKWQGNTYYETGRVINTDAFAPLFDIPNVQVYSAQTFEGSEAFEKLSSKYNIIDISKTFKDFSYTAAAVENLDLVICNDTSLAHIAGAMNKPCVILLPYNYNWRWHTDLSYCDWYKSVTLALTGRYENWNTLMERVTEYCMKTFNLSAK